MQIRPFSHQNLHSKIGVKHLHSCHLQKGAIQPVHRLIRPFSHQNLRSKIGVKHLHSCHLQKGAIQPVHRLHLVMQMVTWSNLINQIYSFILVGPIFVIQTFYLFIKLINPKTLKLIIVNLERFWVICEKRSTKFQPIDLIFRIFVGPQFVIYFFFDLRSRRFQFLFNEIRDLSQLDVTCHVAWPTLLQMT